MHLPKLLLTALPLAILGVLVDHRQRVLLLSATIFISTLSALSHKEWRFIIYTVPFFNLSASVGASYTYVRFPSLSRVQFRWFFCRRWKRSWNSSWLKGMARLAIIGCLVANLCVTALLTITSMSNYPGGIALRAFNEAGRRGNHADGVSSLDIKAELITYHSRHTSTPLQFSNPIRCLPLSSRIFSARSALSSRVDLRQNGGNHVNG